MPQSGKRAVVKNKVSRPRSHGVAKVAGEVKVGGQKTEDRRD